MQKHQRVQTPRPKLQRKRMPMKAVVKKIVDKWSTSYIDGAEKGDIQSVLKLAELQHLGSGYGKIKYNPTQGRRWIEYVATTTQDPLALKQLSRLVIKEEQTRDKLEHIQRYQFNNGEHIGHRFDPAEDLPIMMPKGTSPLWEWRRTMYDEKIAGRAKKEKRLLLQGITPDDPDYERHLQNLRTEYNNDEQDDNLRMIKGVSPVPTNFPQLTSRFELNYAIKSILDGKLQRKITDPIPRPIHEYILVAKTPSPQFVDPVTQSIHLAEMVHGKLQPSLDTIVTGKTYLKEGQSLADLPVIPTPVGTIRRYENIVNDEIFDIQNITNGLPKAYVNTQKLFQDLVQQSYWPTPNRNLGSLIRTMRQSYKDVMDDDEFSKIRSIKIDDDREHHGKYVTNQQQLHNPYFDELNERSDNDFYALHPRAMWDGSEFVTDDELKLDNFRGINIGIEITRELATPVDEGGKFPYNGLPRRSFFLTDPFNLVKPWVAINDSGSEQNDEPLPPNPFTRMIETHVTNILHKNLPQDELLGQIIPDVGDLRYENDTIDGFTQKILDPNPFSPRHYIQSNYGYNQHAELSQLNKLYSPSNYLTREQYSHQYSQSITKFDVEDQEWYIDNDSLNIRLLPKTNDINIQQEQIKQLVQNWLEIYQLQRAQQQSLISNSNRITDSDGEYNLSQRLDNKIEISLRHDIESGRSSHADFGLYASKVALQQSLHEKNNILDNIHKAKVELRDELGNKSEFDEKTGEYKIDYESIMNSDNDIDLVKHQQLPLDDSNNIDLVLNNNNNNNIDNNNTTNNNNTNDLLTKNTIQSILPTKIKKLQRLSQNEIEQQAQIKLNELLQQDPIKYAHHTVNDIISLYPQPQYSDDDNITNDILTFDPKSNLGWIKPIDLDMELAQDGHFTGYEPLGKDLHAYQLSPTLYSKQLNRHRQHKLPPVHPADGSPNALDPTSRLHANIITFRRQYDEIMGSIEIHPNLQGFENIDDLPSNQNDIEDEYIKQQLTTRITELIEKHNNNTLIPLKIKNERGIDQSSEDSELYEQSQPFIRQYIQEYSHFHPFWNRVIPNPNVFLPTPSKTLRSVKRQQINYETSMWNEYGKGSIEYQNVMDELAPQHSATILQTNKNQPQPQFFDKLRTQPYYTDNESEIDSQRIYTRDEIEQNLQSGRFVVARKNDVNIVHTRDYKNQYAGTTIKQQSQPSQSPPPSTPKM